MKILSKKINWNRVTGLVPAIIQDANTNRVLMLGYLNKEALRKTLLTKKVWFYSRSKKRLWMKGETSKNILNLVSINLDCDKDALLIKALPQGPTCHLKKYSCFKEIPKRDTIKELFFLLQSRKKDLPKKSYSASLFKAGLNKITLKVAEEALEVVQAAQKQTKKRLLEETGDLLFHLFVLCVYKNIEFDDLLITLNKK